MTRIGVISDAHGHLEAFRDGCRRLREEGAEAIWYLGDAVGYIPGTGVLESLAASRLTVLRGNHEEMMLRGIEDEETEAVTGLGAIRAALSPELLRFVRSLPPRASAGVGGRQCLFVHGSPEDPTFGYVYPDTDLREFDVAGAAVVFMGNTHIPFVREEGGTLFVNVGSCGLPRGGETMGSACLYDARAHEARIVRFSIAASARRILASGAVHPGVARHLERAAHQEARPG